MSNEKHVDVAYDSTMDPNSLPIVNVDEHSSTENVDLDKKHPLDEKDPEKNLHARSAVEDVDDDDALVREAEELERRLAAGEADEEDWAVTNSHDVATKVLSTFDDPSLPVLTFRVIFLGLGFSAFGSVLAQIYYFKPQSIAVSQGFLLIVSYFFGKALAYLPTRGPFRYINPGPFNIKEHTAIIIMASTAAGSALGIQVISVQDLYYNNDLNPGIAIFTLLASQLIGYGFAGFLQDALVRPTICLWPANLSSASMFQALHFEGGLSVKRERLFWIVFAAIFVYEIIPQWIFPLLTGFSIACIVNHTSPFVRNFFGGASNNEGLGIFSLCLDWNLIGSAALYNPIATQINQNIGIFFTYILMCSVYYGNIWRGKQFPFMSQDLFNSDGTQYNQSLILTDGMFDEAKYAEVGSAWFSATNALYLVVDNLSVGATLVTVFLFYWPEVKPIFLSMNPWNKTVHMVHDEHYEKMKAYAPVPRWWYLAILLSAFAMAQATNYTGNSGLPWWALIVLLIISFILAVVYGTTAAILGNYQFHDGAASFYQMIGAFMVPGNPVANMYCALYGARPLSQCLLLLQDLKLGQYMKIPPRITFFMQVAGAVVGACLNYVMAISILTEQREALLSVAGTRLWSGQNAQSYNSGAIAWGALANKMFVGAGAPYRMVPISLAIGCFLPLPIYALHRLYPKSNWRHINTSIIMQYSCYLSVGVNSSVMTTMVIGVISQWWVRRKYPVLFTKYNYIFAGAMDGGTQVISFILNFAVFGAAGNAVSFPEWWGNPYDLSADRCLAAA